MADTETAHRAQALAAAELFHRKLLPGLLRRLADWKGLDPELHGDQVEDLEQELYADALEHAELICGLEERARNARWFNVLQKCHYWNKLRTDRRKHPEFDVEHLTQSGPRRSVELDAIEGLDEGDRALLEQIADKSIHLGNGRLALVGTARRVGCSPQRVKVLWHRLAACLGHDDERESFWRSRLAEAITDEAATRLCESGHRPVLAAAPPQRSEPERVRRYRRIRLALESRPCAEPVRSVLLRSAPHRDRGDRSPNALLDDAVLLGPPLDRVRLWRFETAMAQEDLLSAAREVRALRLTGEPRRPGHWTERARNVVHRRHRERKAQEPSRMHRPRRRQARSVRVLDPSGSRQSENSPSSISSSARSSS